MRNNLGGFNTEDYFQSGSEPPITFEDSKIVLN